MGDFALGWQGRSEGPRLYGTQLSIARKVLAGKVTVYLLNLGDAEKAVRLSLRGGAPNRGWFKYSVDETALGEPSFQLVPQAVTCRPAGNVLEAEITLPARSLAAVSTYHLTPDGPSMTAE